MQKRILFSLFFVLFSVCMQNSQTTTIPYSQWTIGNDNDHVSWHFVEGLEYNDSFIKGTEAGNRNEWYNRIVNYRTDVRQQIGKNEPYLYCEFPSKRTTATFPVFTGQVPIYYNCKNTGRLYDPTTPWTTMYIDAPNTPLFPFGFGLSYTTFAYSDIKLSSKKLSTNGEITASVDVKNTGMFDGDEIVQLYIRDLVAQSARPVKELKGFQKITLKAVQTKTVCFSIKPEDLKYYDSNMKFIAEPGDFKLFIGTNSRDVKESFFELVK